MARPTDYREEYAEQAYNYCLLGATNDELATFFDVHVSTIYQWKLDHESFSDALKGGKEMADARVARALFSRATGYSHEDVDIKMYEGNIIETPTIKHYPPDATSMIFWLKNRQPEKWREKRDPSDSDDKPDPTPVTVNINVKDASKDA